MLPFHKTFAASAIAACTAELATLPLGEDQPQDKVDACRSCWSARLLSARCPPADTAKVKLQLQPKSGTPKYR